MNVINRMLRALDELHDTTVRHGLPGMVRAVPARDEAAESETSLEAPITPR